MAAKKKDPYSTQGLNDKVAVQQALASAQYQPGEAVNNAASALEQWQASRPGAYQSQYQGQINDLLDQAMLQLCVRPAVPPVRPGLPAERPRRQHRRRGPGRRPDRRVRFQLCHKCGAAGLPAADERAEQRHPHFVQPGAGQLYQRGRFADGPDRRAEPAGRTRRTSTTASWTTITPSWNKSRTPTRAPRPRTTPSTPTTWPT